VDRGVLDASIKYVQQALKKPDEWKSEDAAQVYCRVRSLKPLFDVFGQTLTPDQKASARKLLEQAWSGVTSEAGSDGIYEHGDTKQPFGTKTDVADRYPPNGFLTYWGIASLQAARRVGVIENDALQAELNTATLWLEKCIGTQIALHTINSRRCDPQQLAWAICGLVVADIRPLADRPTPVRELVAAAISVFFARQDDSGTWVQGEPLFHYPTAGNAYSYTFESVGELVNLSLDRTESAVELRRLLLPHSVKLRHTVQNALTTQRRLDGSSRLVGWCSEHHPHRRSPESWATASVLRFLQSMRRLVGIWTRDHVSLALKAQQPTKDLETLKVRGDTWNAGYGSAGLQLATSFVHPICSRHDPDSPDDPDIPPLTDDSARSAILFGPPGTGKTTLAESVAGAIGWKFVEITPAQFLDQGLDRVSSRADEVFNQLMELDRHVVLFDEIDELIRTRSDEAESIGRFFTTTMLPRLARLWKKRGLIFFVNTNVVGSIDSAIRRSERFDLLSFVLPPSFEIKQTVAGLDFVDKAECETILRGEDHSQAAERCAWLPFIRYDQLHTLRHELSVRGSKDQQFATLARFGEDAYNEWAKENANGYSADDKAADRNGKVSDASLQNAIAAFNRQRAKQDIDRTKLRVAVAAKELPIPVHGVTVTVIGENQFIRLDLQEDDLSDWASKIGMNMDSTGRLTTVESQTLSVG
jgi:hypothetical protein